MDTMFICPEKRLLNAVGITINFFIFCVVEKASGFTPTPFIYYSIFKYKNCDLTFINI